jgi:demethylmenaquinone methyltransferase/2-methoxy-6-polyprenyl-1,4-benzoquinol methylase
MDKKLDHSFGTEEVTPQERQRRIRSLFDQVAPRYDLMNDVMSFGVHRWWKRRFVKALPPAGLLVDLAGGTGDIAILASRDPGRTVVVCDPSIEMMQAGQKANRAARVSWVAGQAERMPFADGSVNSLTVAFGLRNVTHLEDALLEARRILKPGGHFACLEFSQPYFWIRPFYDAYSYIMIPRLGAWIAQQPGAYQYLVDSIRRFPPQQVFAQMLNSAGFSDVGFNNLSFGIACIHRARNPA